MKSLQITHIALHIAILARLRPACAAWGVWVSFENDCRRTIRVSIGGDASGTLTIGPYGTDYFDICDGWCTGFLGTTKTYYYYYSAETDSSQYDCFWEQKSNSISISGFDPGGKSAAHSFTCDSSCADDPKPPPKPKPSPPPPPPPPPPPELMPEPPSPSPFVQGEITSEFPELEKFNLELDWTPSTCFEGSSCIDDKVINAFSLEQMDPKLSDRSRSNTRCWDPDSSQAKELNIGAEISPETMKSLECMFQNSVGEDEDLWRDIYVNKGSCSGLSVEEYFDTMVKQFSSINLNRIAFEFGILNGTAVAKTDVDRDEFLDFINSKLGKKAWVECNPDTRILERVLFCLEPVAPFRLVDCTMNRNDPTSTYGIPCDGLLRIPVKEDGGFIQEKCKPYIPYGIAENWKAPEDSSAYLANEGDPGSGTNIGAIIGGVVGGIAALIIISIFLFIYYNHRRKKSNIEAVDSKKSVQNAVHEQPSKNDKQDDYKLNRKTNFDSAYVTTAHAPNVVSLDPFKTWISSIASEIESKPHCNSDEFDFKEIELGQPLGEGSFGRVYEGKYRREPVAIKIFLESESLREPSLDGIAAASNKIIQSMEKEMKVLIPLDHPNVVQFRGYCRVPPCIITELCKRGNLSQMIAHNKEQRNAFPWKDRLQIAIDIARGIQYLHRKSIVHADLKSPNILLTDQGTAKISDFNLSKLLDESMNHSSVAAMNPRWLAPELFNGEKPSKSSDIFSFGVILWELMTLEIPWGTENPWLIVSRLQKGGRLKLEHDEKLCSKRSFKKYCYVVDICWEQDRKQRPSVDRVLELLHDLLH